MTAAAAAAAADSPTAFSGAPPKRGASGGLHPLPLRGLHHDGRASGGARDDGGHQPLEALLEVVLGVILLLPRRGGGRGRSGGARPAGIGQLRPEPNSGKNTRARPSLAWNRPQLGRVRLCWIEFGQCLTKLALAPPKLGPCRPKLPGQIGPKSTKPESSSTHAGPKLGPTQPKFGQRAPTSARCRPKLA